MEISAAGDQLSEDMVEGQKAAARDFAANLFRHNETGTGNIGPTQLNNLQKYFVPDLGLRAIAGFSIGPNGGGTGVIFTTSDEVYDISVHQNSHLVGGSDGPTFPASLIAELICQKIRGSD